MSVSRLSTVRQRRLGAELRRIREERGLTLEVAARRLTRTPSSLSKIERGSQYARTEFVYFALDQYGVTDKALRAELFALAQEQRGKGWWQRYGDALSPSAADYFSLESDAADIRSYETLLIPGLLQTADYARTLIETAQPSLSPRQIDRFVDARMTRQHVLSRHDPPTYSSIIGEAALHQMIGGRETMKVQLSKVLEAADRDHITLQVLPFSAGAHVGLTGPFEIMRMGGPADFGVAIFDNPTGRLFVDQDDEVQRYTERLDRIAEAALSAADSRALVAGLLSKP